MRRVKSRKLNRKSRAREASWAINVGKCFSRDSLGVDTDNVPMQVRRRNMISSRRQGGEAQGEVGCAVPYEILMLLVQCNY